MNEEVHGSGFPVQGLRLRLRLRKRCGERCTVLPVPGAALELGRAARLMGGMMGCKGLRVLVEAGFVAPGRVADGAAAVPGGAANGRLTVCMASLCAHLARTERPGFWTAERRQRYLAARARLRANHKHDALRRRIS